MQPCQKAGEGYLKQHLLLPRKYNSKPQTGNVWLYKGCMIDREAKIMLESNVGGFFMKFSRFQIQICQHTAISAHCQSKHHWPLNLNTDGFTRKANTAYTQL